MAISDNGKREIELQVRRALSEERQGSAAFFEQQLKEHTGFLEKQLSHLKWTVLAIFTIASGVLIFFVGRSYKEAESIVKGQVEDRIINYEIDESLNNTLQGRIESLVKLRFKSEVQQK